MTHRRVLAFTLLFSIGPLTLVEHALAQNAPTQFIPFYSFLQSVQNAAPEHWVNRPGSRIRDAATFEAMREHILDMYSDVPVVSSFVLDGHPYDCIPVNRQPAARLLAPDEKVSPPPASSGFPPSSGIPQIRQKTDEFGNSIGCTPGNIPMRRITLEDLSRFEMLDQFLRKRPGDLGPLAPAGAIQQGHKYALSDQQVTNYGGSSTFNLWNPPIDTANGQIFSLSQVWFVNYISGNDFQTVEAGWQVFPALYNTPKAALFVSWTANGYNGTGCYNKLCRAFVQTNPNVFLGTGWDNYSVEGGNQYEIRLTWRLYNGNWWLAYGFNDWVGFYPGSIFQRTTQSGPQPGPLTDHANAILFGGETVGNNNWPQMGSGKPSNSGYGKAAYHRNIFYIYNTQGNTKRADNLQPPAPSFRSRCYTEVIFNHAGSGTSLYFGGRGGTSC